MLESPRPVSSEGQAIKPRIIAVIITFHPESAHSGPLLRTLLAQAEQVLVIDNTPGEANVALKSAIAEQPDSARCELICMQTNRGIGHAINVGLVRSLELAADFVLLSDQDSLPADDMVAELLAAHTRLTAAGMPVGAIGPTYHDLYTGLTYPFQVRIPGRQFYGHRFPSAEEPDVETLTLITSGTLISATVARAVGGMRADYFIDQVDIEWCHRARAMGYRLYGTGLAHLSQRMGDAKLRVWYLRWRNESLYSPTRIYYRVRNFVGLWKLDYIDWRWKIRSTWYSLGVVFAHCLFAERDNLAYLSYAIRGLWHGLRNRMGPIDTGGPPARTN